MRRTATLVLACCLSLVMVGPASAGCGLLAKIFPGVAARREACQAAQFTSVAVTTSQCSPQAFAAPQACTQAAYAAPCATQGVQVGISYSTPAPTAPRGHYALQRTSCNAAGCTYARVWIPE